jgi:hypothetical protein
VISTLILTLPLMLGGRTPLSVAVLVTGMGVVALMVFWPRKDGSIQSDREQQLWGWFALAFSLYIWLQVLPVPFLAEAFGPYPAILWQQPDFAPLTWSPNPHATLEGWVVFLALFTAAYATRHLPHRYLGWIALAAVCAALFQAVYGLLAFTQGEETILRLWPRPATHRLSGSFTNSNLAAHFLAMIWPLAVTLWWIPDVPVIRRLPSPLRVAGTIVAGSLIGLALFSTASRLGAAAGLLALIILVVLRVRQRHRDGTTLWPLYVALAGAGLAALWFGLMPLTTRYIGEGLESQRWEVWGLMLRELPWQYWVSGVGLGGFEAVFRTVQSAHITAWYNYAHNDLLQWLLEMGVVGAVLLVAAVIALVQRWRNGPLRAPVYAGMAALALVALGDFSWHVGATQLLAACYLGILLRPAAGGRRRRSSRHTAVGRNPTHTPCGTEDC